MIFLKKSIGVEDIVLEWFHIYTIQGYQTIGPHDIDTGRHYTIGAGDICSETSKIGWSLLQITEVLSQELDWVLRTILEK